MFNQTFYVPRTILNYTAVGLTNIITVLCFNRWIQIESLRTRALGLGNPPSSGHSTRPDSSTRHSVQLVSGCG